MEGLGVELFALEGFVCRVDRLDMGYRVDRIYRCLWGFPVLCGLKGRF